jgi:murein DD-endopeptidase MepM/ murein hydrolase activator NlpD
MASVSLGAGIAIAGQQSTYAGGVGTPPAPAAEDVRCVSRCLDVRTVTETGRAEVLGKNLGSVTRVRFGGVRVEPRRVGDTFVRFDVPEGAGSGRPTVVDETGAESKSPVRLKVMPASEITETEGFAVRRAKPTHRKTFFKSRKPSRLEYLFEAEGPTDVRIDVLRGKNRKVVHSIVQRGRDPFKSHTARWGGLNPKGRVAGNGKYRFRVKQLAGGKGGGAGFQFYDHIFPIPAPHTYGDGLGAGRNHQGQDIFARCGVKVLAARGGRIKHRAYHSRAGYYIVIDGFKTGVDYAYMHLAKKGRPKLGSRVRTGQRIGFNSDTGNASGCHLHFEMWSAPGWYSGGSPMDATPHMRRWDSWS